MSAKDGTLIEAEGTVVKMLAGAMFRVKLDQGIEILATPSGKMRKNFIRRARGDRVRCELSAYDLTRGRITYRLKR